MTWLRFPFDKNDNSVHFRQGRRRAGSSAPRVKTSALSKLLCTVFLHVPIPVHALPLLQFQRIQNKVIIYSEFNDAVFCTQMNDDIINADNFVVTYNFFFFSLMMVSVTYIIQR
jgi:hypothetical protein